MLLYERIPPSTTAPQAWGRPRKTQVFRAAVGPRTWSMPVRSPVPHYTLLSNGHYGVMLNADGGGGSVWNGIALTRSEEHTSELQSLMRISYAVFCLKKKIKT